MSDRAWARLTVGGTVSFDALVTWLDQHFNASLVEILDRPADAMADDTGTPCLIEDQLVIEDYEKDGGGWEDAELELQALGLPFDRINSAGANYPEGYCWWRPDFPKIIEYSTLDGDGVIGVTLLRGYLDNHDLSGLRKYLDAYYPIPSPLPPLVILRTSHEILERAE